MIKNKKILFALVIIISFVVIGKTQASETDNVTGWLWGGGTELDGASPWNGSNTNVGWISMNNTNQAGTTPYGVNIPATDDAVTGNAWSENIGYINFAPVGPYPAVVTGDDYSYATRRLGDKLVGWARFEEIRMAGANAGGWSGWIRLSSDANDPIAYGVDITKMDGTGTNPTYAWSDELGWIDFSRASITVATPGACGDADSNVGGNYASDDTEWTAGGTRPGNACNAGTLLTAFNFPSEGTTVNWTCSGTPPKNCSVFRASASCSPNNCELNTCVGDTCDNSCEIVDGAKVCQNKNWREVSPN